MGKEGKDRNKHQTKDERSTDITVTSSSTMPDGFTTTTTTTISLPTDYLLAHMSLLDGLLGHVDAVGNAGTVNNNVLDAPQTAPVVLSAAEPIGYEHRGSRQRVAQCRGTRKVEGMEKWQPKWSTPKKLGIPMEDIAFDQNRYHDAGEIVDGCIASLLDGEPLTDERIIAAIDKANDHDVQFTQPEMNYLVKLVSIGTKAMQEYGHTIASQVILDLSSNDDAPTLVNYGITDNLIGHKYGGRVLTEVKIVKNMQVGHVWAQVLSYYAMGLIQDLDLFGDIDALIILNPRKASQYTLNTSVLANQHEFLADFCLHFLGMSHDMTDTVIERCQDHARGEGTLLAKNDLTSLIA